MHDKTAFNEMIVGDLIEQTRLFKEHKIYFVATNKMAIRDYQILEPVL